MLTKSELIQTIIDENEEYDFKRAEVRNIIESIVKIAEDEIAAGNDFKIDGLCRISYKYTTPRKKGTKYVNPITKETLTADKARPAKIAIRATPAAPLKKAMPSLNSKAGKAVAARKG